MLKYVFTVLMCLPACHSFAAEQPNIVVIFTDDHGYSDLSCQNVRDDIKTPNIDRLAAGGVRFTSGYVTAPQCVPSRAGLLSGRYQNRFGLESNNSPVDGFERQETIAEKLKEAGYATGMVGKWHLGSAPRIVKHGFDDVFYQGGTWTNFDIEGNDVRPGTKFNELYHLDAGSAAAKAFIARHHDEPFFLYVAYRAPHVPLDATEKYLNRFPGEMPERRRQALAMLSAVDDGVGGIMESLQEYGLEEQTLIFFIGDNGAPLKIHKQDIPGGGPGWDGSLNEPYNGEKGMLTEGGIRVPFVMSWKGTIPAGMVSDQPVISLDVVATASRLAGLPYDRRLDGANLIPFLKGDVQAVPHPTLYWRWMEQAAIREGRWKYLRGGSREYLFDLDADPEEKQNLLQENPDVAVRLEAKLRSWAAGLRPAGLQTKPMTGVRETYFDYYLDGKPAPPPPPIEIPRESVENWRPRNCVAKRNRDGYVATVVDGTPSNRDVYITMNKLKLPKTFRVKVDASGPQAGPVAIEWRHDGQKEFVKSSRVYLTGELKASPSELQGTVQSDKPVIHIRVLFPSTGITIRTITLQRETGALLHNWDFRTESSGAE